MNYATNIALVNKETDLVSNIVWGMVYQEEEFNTGEDFPVIIENLNVAIGDLYDGESFYHDGVKVLTINEQLAELNTALEILTGEYNSSMIITEEDS